jgi:Ca-activated chloride channel family protein
MSNIHFEYPEVFLLFIIFIIFERFCKARTNAILFPKVQFFSGITSLNGSFTKYLRWLIIILIILATSSPYKILTENIKPKNGLNIALMLDTSESMRALGFQREDRKLNRFEIVRDIVGDFIEQRTHDNLGLVVFGEYAFISSPLTFDKHILKEMLNNIHIGIAGKSTAIYDAIGQTVSLLKTEENASNIAILITDGINTAGVLQREKAIELAKNHKIKIYTIGIGRMGDINPIDLQDIAEKTGGQFFLARDGGELRAIYQQIDKIEKREIKDLSYEVKDYLYFYPLLLIILLLTIFISIKKQI